MYLSMAVLMLLVGAFFVVNGNFSINAGAHFLNSKRGILRKDLNHNYPCNRGVKADYVIQDPANAQNCTPVIANPSDAEKTVGHNVQLNGVEFGGRFFTTGVTTIPDSGVLPSSPPTYLKPFHTPGPTGGWTGPATRNLY